MNEGRNRMVFYITKQTAKKGQKKKKKGAEKQKRKTQKEKEKEEEKKKKGPGAKLIKWFFEKRKSILFFPIIVH
jgi:hypothetical protein